MSLTLGLTGMDPATETALKAAFAHANAQLDGQWTLLPETEAEHVMVDMDSMYGPMSWLRLHAAGRKVIGLTTAARTQTDFRLGRPFDSDSFSALLRSIASDQGVEPGAPAPATTAETATTPPAPTRPATETAQAEPATTSKRTAMQEPAVSAAVDAALPAAVDPQPQPEHASVPRDTGLADWLAPGALSERVRFRAENGQILLIDPAGRNYHGQSALKPLASCFEGVVHRDDLEAVDDVTWARESAAAGTAQPLQRLQWLGGLVAGKGKLLPGHDPEGRYRLNKWPQTEREYPKHFRIATAMMKGPATVAEIAEGSGMPAGDVADFINANLVTGFAEPVVETPPEPVEATKPGGLFGRLRGR